LHRFKPSHVRGWAFVSKAVAKILRPSVDDLTGTRSIALARPLPLREFELLNEEVTREGYLDDVLSIQIATPFIER
jgi:hypothetical protein